MTGERAPEREDGGRSGGPALGRRVFRALVPADRRDDLCGDLAELYAAQMAAGRQWARLWYWRQIFEISGRLAWARYRGRGARNAECRGRRRPGGLFAPSDIKLATRMIARTPALSTISVIAMAVGIGLATCAYSVIGAVFFAVLPLPEGERIVRLESFYAAGGYPVRTAPAVFESRRAVLASFESVIGYETRRVGIEAGDAATSGVVHVAWVTPNAFAMLGVAPVLGRTLIAADNEPGSAAVVIGHALWRGRFGSDPDIVGRSVRIDGAARTIVGVMPEGFLFPNGQQAWLPVDPGRTDRADAMPLWMAAKLAEGVDLASAGAEWRSVAAREPSRDGYEAADLGARVVPFTRPANDTEPVVLAATALVVLVLLVTAANVANLLLARTSARMGEMAVRVALGASRTRIINQLFVEALAMGSVAAVLGVIISRPLLSWFRQYGDLPWWAEFRLDPGVLAFAAAAAVFASVIAGIPPAFKATSQRLEDVLRDQGPAASGLRFGRWSTGLLVAQVTLSIGLLSTATLVAQGLYEQAGQEFGVPEDEVVVAQVYWGQPEPEPGMSRAATWERFRQRADASRRRVEEELRALPGAIAVASSSGVPGQDWISPSERRPVEVEGERGSVLDTHLVRIGRGYFDTYDVRLLAGRGFDAVDRRGDTRAVIVNRPFVRRHLGDGEALGRRLRWGVADADGTVAWNQWLEIVGVIPDIGVSPTDPARADAIYLPLAPTNIVLVSARSRGDLAVLTSDLYEIVAEEEMSAEVQLTYTLEELIDGPAGPLRSVGISAMAIGGVALLLSACGLYAIVSFAVTRRTKEIGIRRALGASGRAVLSTVLIRATMPLIVGAALGVGLGGTSAAGLTRLLPLDPFRAGAWTLLAVAALMLAVGLLACLVPVRRALAVRPVEALRQS